MRPSPCCHARLCTRSSPHRVDRDKIYFPNCFLAVRIPPCLLSSARLRRCRYVISIIRVALPVQATANPVARQRPSSRIRNIAFGYQFLGLRRWGQVRPRGVRTISSRYARNGCTSKRRRRPPAESRRAGWRAAAHLPPRCICACVGPFRGSCCLRPLADDRRTK